MSINTILTDIGIQSVFNANNLGFEAEISHIAFGDGGYAPSYTATALQSEKQRVMVAGGERQGAKQIQLTAKLTGDIEFWVREVGVFLNDGTLLALYSDPVKTLGYKAAGIDFLTSFDLVLDRLPDDSVTFTVDGNNLNLSLAEPLIQSAVAHTKLAAITIKMLQRQFHFEKTLEGA
ncbi:phage tail-collar fiber domain-containing protein [Piscirickettsia litoralis]|uniref:Phage tail fibre protein N-terminal domain-containing protein n=1 Tax=Piscirickettsia litoralis TaxID=1891921 RepID=A0ABX2ZY96_9GAMM|nr:phage tail protein [Piscirickettsia litoralis]ODN41552.1 hypothetical protein BGC07_15705 [Piscirickettsia litoralis]